MIRAVNVFFERVIAVEFTNLIGQFSLVTQTLTSAVFWFRIYWKTNVYFADDPLLWISKNLSHGVPLLAIIAEQILVPKDFNQESLRFIVIGLSVYAVFDAVMTLASDGSLIAYRFLKWQTKPLTTLFTLIIISLLVIGEI